MVQGRVPVDEAVLAAPVHDPGEPLRTFRIVGIPKALVVDHLVVVDEGRAAAYMVFRVPSLPKGEPRASTGLIGFHAVTVLFNGELDQNLFFD